jgi:hypothetical protein
MNSNLVVLPRIEVDNPFGAIINTLANDVMPFVQALAINKEKVAQLSDTELSDYVPVLKQYAPDLLTQDGKIDWTKVNEYATSDDVFKQKVAHIVSTARKFREEYAKQPIIVKLNKINEVAMNTDPTILQKYGSTYQALQKFKTVITNTNLPDEIKYAFLLNAEKFIEKPEYIELLDKLLGEKKEQNTTQQNTSSWKFSLDGAKQFGIKLEEPKLTPLQVSPIQAPVEQKPKPVVKQVGGVGSKKQPKQSSEMNTQKQQSQNTTIKTFWRDGVLWEMRKRKDGKVEYVPREAPLVEQDLDPFSLLFGNFIPKLVPEVGRVAGKVFGRVAGKVFGRGASKVAGKGAQETAENVAENVAKETAENVASKQTTSEAQNVVKQANKYDKRREEVKKKIEEQLKKKEPAGAWKFAYEKPSVEKEFETVPITKYAKQVRQSKLPVLAPKETRWEFGNVGNAKPPAPVSKKEVSIIKPEETPYKETVARQGFKTSQKLEEFLKKTQPKTGTKQAVLTPIKKLENLVKEIPEEAKNNPEIRRRFVEITRDLKKISGEAPFRDVSDDLRVLDAKVDELKALLKKQYGGTKTATEKTTPKTKKKKSNQ